MFLFQLQSCSGAPSRHVPQLSSCGRSCPKSAARSTGARGSRKSAAASLHANCSMSVNIDSAAANLTAADVAADQMQRSPIAAGVEEAEAEAAQTRLGADGSSSASCQPMPRLTKEAGMACAHWYGLVLIEFLFTVVDFKKKISEMRDNEMQKNTNDENHMLPLFHTFPNSHKDFLMYLAKD